MGQQWATLTIFLIEKDKALIISQTITDPR
jgi:hypothetical protein